MTTVVIDANLALALVVPLRYSSRVEHLFEDWQTEDIQFAAPALWGYEVVSALRKVVAAEVMSDEEAGLAVRDLWGLGVREIEGTIERHRRALSWSSLLGQRVANDAQYLVVAEELSAPLWTADRSLHDRARQAGAEWVHWIGESEVEQRES